MPPLTQITEEARFEVIASWPGMDYKLNEIINGDKIQLYTPPEDYEEIFISMSDYPHLFRRLAWYEKRELAEMPLYVRLNYAKDKSIIYKANYWNVDYLNRVYFNTTMFNNVSDFYLYLYEGKIFPATAEEYNNQFNHIGTL